MTSFSPQATDGCGRSASARSRSATRSPRMTSGGWNRRGQFERGQWREGQHSQQYAGEPAVADGSHAHEKLADDRESQGCSPGRSRAHFLWLRGVRLTWAPAVTSFDAVERASGRAVRNQIRGTCKQLMHWTSQGSRAGASR